jgi:tRNA (guanine10-N2)-dimethyltransferase
VPNKTASLNSAQVQHNKLLGNNGWELVVVKSAKQVFIAQTIKVQDIEAYAARDQNRPKRDMKVGMLPPKLAQIMINLAVGILPAESRQSVCDIPADQPIPRAHLNRAILDPFCGSGVVLQEALLAGYNVLGSDIDQRMVDYAIVNVHDWLKTRYPDLKGYLAITKADATNTKWSNLDWQRSTWPDHKLPGIDFVVSETYLGEAYSSLPTDERLVKSVASCNLIIKNFLTNLAPQIKPGTRLCLAVPAWQISPQAFKHLPVIDQIESLGYNRVSFVHLKKEALLYFRPGQIVARELIILTRS